MGLKMSDASPPGVGNADTGGENDPLKRSGGDPPPPPPPPRSPAAPIRPVRPADPTAALADIGEDLLSAYKRTKPSDWVGVFALVVATAALIVSGQQARVAGRQYTVAEQQYRIAKDQYEVAVSALKGNALIQLRQDNAILTKFIAENANNINDISKKNCQERIGDIGYDNEYKMAKNELHEIVDFYDFYSLEKHEYNVISSPDWTKYAEAPESWQRAIAFTKLNLPTRSALATTNIW